MAIEGIEQVFKGALAAGTLVSESIVIVEMDLTPPVTGGGTTATVGFQLKFGDSPLKEVNVLEYHVLLASTLTPVSSGTLDLATAGTILLGTGSDLLKAQTDANGKFTCRLTDAIDETVLLVCNKIEGSPILDCSDTRSVPFSA